MRIIADGFVLDSSSMGAPGIDEVRWLKPLRPGTQIRVRATVLESRPSKSRPEMGLTKFRYEVIDDADNCLTTMVTTAMLGRREPEARAVKYLRGHPGRRRVRATAATPSPPTSIKAFAVRFDPQPFHVDETAAAALAFRRAVSPPAGTPRWSGCG